MPNRPITIHRGENYVNFDYHRLSSKTPIGTALKNSLAEYGVEVTCDEHQVKLVKTDKDQSCIQITLPIWALSEQRILTPSVQSDITTARQDILNAEIDDNDKDAVMTLLENYLLLRKPNRAYTPVTNHQVDYNYQTKKWTAVEGSGLIGTLMQHWRNFVDIFTTRNTRIMLAKKALYDLNPIYWPPTADTGNTKQSVEQQRKFAKMNAVLQPYEDNNKLGGKLGMLFQFSAHAQYYNPDESEAPEPLSNKQKEALKSAFVISKP